MKRVLKAIVVMAVAGILLTSAFPAFAIGFDAEKVYESVFVIYADNFIGSGFAIGGNCIVTNAHVVDGAENIVIATYGGDRYKAGVFAMDDDLDIAVLTVSQAQFQPLPVADVGACKIGDDIYTIGAPDSMAYTLTKGVVSAKERVVGKQAYIQIDAAVNAGNSGGPLLNDRGEVLGINTLKMSDSEGIGLSIPMDTVCDYLVRSGIKLDDDNNVASTLEAPQTSEVTKPAPEASSGGVNSANSANPILIVFLCLSVLLNIALIIVLVYERRKPPKLKTDPSERTDFEIEIEE